MREELMRSIKTLNETIWEHKVKEPNVLQWLSNFTKDGTVSDERQLYALHLLSQFMYFGWREVPELLKAMYRDLFRYPIVEAIRRSNSDTTDLRLINTLFDIELSQTRFVGVGNPSESGSLLLYFFRQENRLPTNLFLHAHQIFKRSSASTALLADRSIKRYVFLDDICGTGDQGVTYSKEILQYIKKEDPSTEICYYVLFSTSDGLNEMSKNTQYDYINCVFELDETFKCFNQNSRYFLPQDTHINKASVEEMCLDFGSKLWAAHPLGYKGCQLMLALSYNTPDNTLPIFWCDVNWTPIFKRYIKLG